MVFLVCVAVDDMLQQRFGAVDLRVLSDEERPLEQVLLCRVRAGGDAQRTRAAPVEERLHFVKTELALFRVLLPVTV